ncbi:hypothetical protein CXG81DRAFT_18525 [Caulochytrium protostelioides]|uniref:VWFD domain-containing protein n=1 Tax=Caulochytrium protostelioides TaxID=1555241 RepID=A0A4P9X8V6_9FUNG|nr:hypothetical protein CXG81DRAFT_18525 [Caulochytrium protostelioides]|eukprot:RKP01705.1 hypothetical protein CXG81DRAFT_18525 [Caulochytrium protostelioides]
MLAITRSLALLAGAAALVGQAYGTVTANFLESNQTTIQLSDAALSEAAGFRLKVKPTSSVTVYFQSVQSSLQLSECQLTFTPDNWNQYQPIVFQGTPVVVTDTTKTLTTDVTYQAGPYTELAGSKGTVSVVRNVYPSAQCMAVGDPHITSFGKTYFSYQSVGTYWLIKSDALSIQAYQFPCTSGENGPSCIGAIAVNYRGSVFAASITQKVTTGKITLQKISKDLKGITFPTETTGTSFTIQMDDGSRLVISTLEYAYFYLAMNVYVTVPAGSYQTVGGLCSGQGTAALIGSDGVTYQPSDSKQLSTFYESWAVPPSQDAIRTGQWTVPAAPGLSYTPKVCTMPPMTTTTKTTTTTTLPTTTTTTTTVMATTAGNSTTMGNATTTSADAVVSTTLAGNTTTTLTMTSAGPAVSTTSLVGNTTTLAGNTTTLAGNTTTLAGNTTTLTTMLTATTTEQPTTTTEVPIETTTATVTPTETYNPSTCNYDHTTTNRVSTITVTGTATTTGAGAVVITTTTTSLMTTTSLPQVTSYPDMRPTAEKHCKELMGDACKSLVDVEPFINACVDDIVLTGTFTFAEAARQMYMAACNIQSSYALHSGNTTIVNDAEGLRSTFGFANTTAYVTATQTVTAVQTVTLDVTSTTTNTIGETVTITTTSTTVTTIATPMAVVAPQAPVLQCVNDCSGNGICMASGCACAAGWSGTDCSIDAAAVYSSASVSHLATVTPWVVVDARGQNADIYASSIMAADKSSVSSVLAAVTATTQAPLYTSEAAVATSQAPAYTSEAALATTSAPTPSFATATTTPYILAASKAVPQLNLFGATSAGGLAVLTLLLMLL